jgi:hypothetical protein
MDCSGLVGVMREKKTTTLPTFAKLKKLPVVYVVSDLHILPGKT